MEDVIMSYERDEYLAHYGVKGMRWGSRRGGSRPQGISRKTNKQARRDAEEFARAKMFYGEGAGTRRKLIKATVNSKSKHDKNYARAFDYNLNLQNMSYHAQKARSERSSKDRRKKTKQVGGAVARRVTGEQGTTAALVGIGIMGYAFTKSPRGKRMITKAEKKTTSVLNKSKRYINARKINSFLNN